MIWTGLLQPFSSYLSETDSGSHADKPGTKSAIIQHPGVYIEDLIVSSRQYFVSISIFHVSVTDGSKIVFIVQTNLDKWRLVVSCVTVFFTVNDFFRILEY